MTWLRVMALRIRERFAKPRLDAELDEELQSHLGMLVEENIQRGMSHEEARRAARIAMGGTEQIKEAVRDQRGLPFLESLVADVRFGLRMLRKSPGFTAVVVLTLALGIGANTAIFSLWNEVLHSSLPGVYHPNQLVMLSNPDEVGMWTGRWVGRTDGDRPWLTYSEFEQLRDRADLFSSLMASQSSLDTWQVRSDSGDWEDVHGRFVSGGFFQVLGIRPLIGRVFTIAEDNSDSPCAVIGYSYWQRRFGGRADVLGKTIALRKTVLTIVGVTPRGFIGETSGQSPDLWVPLRMQPSVMPGRDWLHDTPPQKVMWLNVFGRVKPGVSEAQVEAQANAIFQVGLESFYGASASEDDRRESLDQHLRIHPGAGGASETRSDVSISLTALFAAVSVLLTIACANISNLLLARGAAREPEFSLRLSLGANRYRLIFQLATESLILSVVGGLAGLALAYVLYSAMVNLLAEGNPDFQMSFSLDPPVLAFNAGLVLAVTFLVSFLPIRQSTHTDAGAALRQQGRTSKGSPMWRNWSRFLVALQLALCLPLLVGAGLLVRTLYNVQRINLGFPAHGLLLVRVNSTEAGYDTTRKRELLRDLTVQFQRMPGVRAASYSLLGVFTGGNTVTRIDVSGYLPAAESDRHSAADVVGPAYFSTLGVPMIDGREILDSDNENGPKVCVINEAFAKQFFNGQNPVGLYVTSIEDDKRTTFQVVGIAADARTHDLRGEVAPRYFMPEMQLPSSLDTPIFLIRTTTEATPIIGAIRQSIQRVDAALPIIEANSIEEQIAPLTAQDRTTERIAVVFGCVALTLAAIGLYGVLSYGIARRTGEIGVRIALGAQPLQVISMILRETMGLVVLGLVPGAAFTYAASRLIDSRLYGVAPQDPVTLASATAALLLVTFTASYIPARRATKVDPIVALRHE